MNKCDWCGLDMDGLIGADDTCKCPTYSWDAYDGIAFSIVKRETMPDEDTEWTGIEEETGNVIVMMVGDDRPFVVDPDELVKIDDGDWCPGCGQIGCKAYAF